MTLKAHAAAAGATTVGLRPTFVTPAAAHSHPDCRSILILIVALHATFIALVLGKAVWPEVARATIGAFTHLVLWSPLLIFLAVDRMRALRRGDHGTGTFGTVYSVWLYAVIGVLTISLLLDGREVLLVR